MSLEQKIQAELKAAMLSKNEPALRALRAVKSAILLARTSGSTKDMTPDDEIKMLRKLIKQRKESAEIYRHQNREDLAKTEEEEIAIIERFLPDQMTEAEITEVLKQIILQTGATEASQTGKVIGLATKQLAGKADNKIIAALVKQLLS